MDDKTDKVAQLLTQTGDDQRERLAKDLLPIVYDELRELAQKYLRGERKNHTLQPTALVHEAFMRLVDQSRVNWQGRTHFFAVGAQAMRRILIDHARARGRGKRGGDWQRVVLSGLKAEKSIDEVDSITLHDALETLASLDEQQARIVELRFFGGLTVEEVAKVMGVSKRKIEGDWTHAKAWLRNKLDSGSQP